MEDRRRWDRSQRPKRAGPNFVQGATPAVQSLRARRGPVWRYQDADNYYICRQNPLENNFRVYKVIDGKRTQLASTESKAAAGKWHVIKVTMRKDNIVCSINGKKLIVRDGTIKKPGKTGLWTKADAVTHFDDFAVKPIGK